VNIKSLALKVLEAAKDVPSWVLRSPKTKGAAQFPQRKTDQLHFPSDEWLFRGVCIRGVCDDLRYHRQHTTLAFR
jgi:hypothetical protein